MKISLYISFFMVFLACKNQKELTSSELESSAVLWEHANYKPEKGAILPTNYSTYILNTKLFAQALENGSIELPNYTNTWTSYQVKRSATMSESLQEKFPNIRSYEGQELKQKQNQVRIDQKNDSFKIVVYTSSGTYFIQELETSGIYYFFNKADLPENTGLINE
ncbi:MAG: hypothetical protein H6579_07765 [Chitinophagales bacterium]|nr:hypothetical protein [Chitinophagales bacterium]